MEEYNENKCNCCDGYLDECGNCKTCEDMCG